LLLLLLLLVPELRHRDGGRLECPNAVEKFRF
jgi:hypothetical protein